MTITLVRVESASGLFNALDTFSQTNTVYRGQRDAEWRLRSTLSEHRLVPFDQFIAHDIDVMLNNFLVYAKGIGLEPPFGNDADSRHARLEFRA